MKDIKYYHTTTNNAQVLRLIDGVMQVFDIEKKWVDSIDWFNKIFFNDFTDFEEISENDAFAYIALAIAKKAHAGQVDKAGVDYMQHPLYVASQVKTEQEKAVALLHDVIEDSDVTADDLLASGLSNEVVAAVQILTKKKGQSYQEYLEKVKSNNLARIVKLADLKHNSDLSRLKSVTNTDYERVKKYKNAIHYLST